VKNSLKNVNEKIGDIFNNFQAKNEKKIIDPLKDQKKLEVDVSVLTDTEKEKIDIWLEKNGYNRYGDPGGIVYTGGTPLFNEATGESIDRFEYILKKHPNILDTIKD